VIWYMVVIYILILVFEVPALIKNHWYREIVVFSAFFIFGLYLVMVQFYYWPFYNPMQVLLPYFAPLVGY
jgi:hypothetical protein